MSRFSNVAWKEGLFINPPHLQQADRYMKRLYEVLVSLIGDLTVFEVRDCRVRDVGHCRDDRPRQTFEPLVYHIRRLLSPDAGRALRLTLELELWAIPEER